MSSKSQAKQVYSLLFLLLIISIGFSVPFATGFYRFTNSKGYVNSLGGIGVEAKNIVLTCTGAGGYTASTQTTSTGYYDFSSYGNQFFCTDNCGVTCRVSASDSLIIVPSNSFSFTVKNGAYEEVGKTVNMVYNAYIGKECFNFNQVSGSIKSNDGLIVKNQNVLLSCNNKNYTATTNNEGIFNFTTTNDLFACDAENNCNINCTLTSENITLINSSFTARIEEVETSCNAGNTQIINYYTSGVSNANLDVAGLFEPDTASTYGPVFSFTFTPYVTVNECRFSETNNDYSGMTNVVSGYVGFAPSQASHTFYVACDTPLTTEDSLHTESATYNFDLQKPVITNLDNSSGSILDSIPANVTITLNEDSKCQVSGADTGYDYGLTNCSNNYSTNTACELPPLFEGINNFYVNCVDAYGNYYNSTDNVQASYDIDTANPEYAVDSESVMIGQNNPYTINWILYDAHPSRYEYYYQQVSMENSSWINAQSVPKTVNTLNLGMFNYTLIFNDTLGHKNSSTVIVEVTDLNAPVITLILPVNNSVIKNPVIMKISLSEEITNCAAEYNNINHTMNKLPGDVFNLTDNFTDALHNVKFYCNDTYNNTGFNQIFFTVDNTPPEISIDINDSMLEYAVDAVNITLNISELHLEECLLYAEYPDESLLAETNDLNIAFNPDVLTQLGVYTIEVYCTDFAGNYNSTSNYFTVSDTSNPVVTLLSPDNELLNGTVLFNCLAVNHLLNDATLYGNWSAGWHADQTIPLSGEQDYAAFTKNISTGFYEWNCYVCDTSSNCAFAAENKTFETDNTNPVINLTISDSMVEYGMDNVNVSYTITEANPDYCSFTIYYPNSTLLTSPLSNEIILTPSELTAKGDYTAIVYCNDALNNSASAIDYFNVNDTLPPAVTIVSPNQAYYTKNNILFNITLDSFAEWCGYSLDGFENITLTNESLFSWHYENNSVPEGFHYAEFYCNDTSNNMGMNNSVFTIETTPPIIENVLHSYTSSSVLGLNNNLTISADVLDALPGVSEVLFDSQKAQYNIGSIYYYNHTCSDTNQYWNNEIFANDTLGNNNTLSGLGFSWYCDVSPPSITDCSFNASTASDGAIVRLNCEINEEGYASIDTVLFSTNLGALTPSNTTINDYYYDFLCNNSIAGNVILLSAEANDTLGNNNTVSFSDSFFCDAFGPEINNVSSIPAEAPKGNNTCISANVTDEMLDKVWINTSLQEYGNPDTVYSIYYLSDDGIGCDLTAGDNIFSHNLVLDKYGYYNISTINANDTESQITEIILGSTVYSYDNTPPLIVSTQVLGSYQLNNGESTVLRARVQDYPNGVDNVLFKISGNNYTYTSKSVDLYDYVVNCNNDYDYNWTDVFAFDSSNYASNKTVNYNTITCDTLYPIVTEPFVDDYVVTQAEGLNVTTTASDYHLDNVWVMITSPAGVVHNYTLNSLGGNNFGVIALLNETGVWFVNQTFANDTYNHVNSSGNAALNITVEAMDEPFIANCGINNTLLQNGGSARMSCFVNDDEGIDTVLFELNNTNNTITDVNNHVYYKDFICGISLNIHWTNVFVNDTGIPVNSSAHPLDLTLYCDVDNPVISNYASPPSTLTLGSNLLINATITDNNLVVNPRVSITYSNNSFAVINLNNLGGNIYGTSIPLASTGNYTIHNMSAEDVVGNNVVMNINEKINSADIFPPVINIQSPFNGTYDTHNVSLIFTAQDPYFSQSWYTLNNVNATSAVSNSILTLPDGFYELRLYANDTYSNTGMRDVSFTVDAETSVKDLSINSVSVPSNAYLNENFTLLVNITNEGGTDALGANLTIYDNSNVARNELINVLEGETIIFSYNMSISAAGSHNITVYVVPPPEETDRTDNSGTDFITIKSYIEDVNAVMSAPKIVMPGTNFTAKLYLYNNANKTLDLISNLTVPAGFTIQTINPAFTIVPISDFAAGEWNITSAATPENYTISTKTWVSNESTIYNIVNNKIVEVTPPHSPLFSVDLTIIPATFILGQNNIVIADIYNYGNETATNSKVTLHLSGNLELVTGDYTYYMGDLVNGTSNSTTWIITPNSTIGSYEISVFAEYDGGSDADNETITPTYLPNLTTSDIVYSHNVENNTLLVYNFTVSNTGMGNATNVYAYLLLGNNTIPGKINETFNLNAGEQKYLSFNFTPINNGSSKSFKLVVEHSNSSYYYEIINTYSVWLDMIAPADTIVNGYATVDGANIIYWTPVADAYKYYVYKGVNGQTDFNVSNPNVIIMAPTLIWRDDYVDLNKWYYYRVAAVDYAGNIGNLSDYVKIIPMDFKTQEDELEYLQSQLSQYTAAAAVHEQEEQLTAQVNGEITSLLNDMQFFTSVSELLTPEQYQKVHNIMTVLQNANSQTTLNDRKAYLNEAKYLLQSLGAYSTGLETHIYTNTIGNLTVKTTESVISVELNDKNHNKHDVAIIVMNPSNNILENITLYFDVPSDAILSNGLIKENNQLIFTIDSLNPGGNATITYSFLSYSEFASNGVNALMKTIIPASGPSLVTGFAGSVFNKTSNEAFNPVYIGLVWLAVLILSVSYFQKKKLVKVYYKVKDNLFKNEEDDIIDIKIEK
ncbi:hypothetical protein COS83_01540 [archaeon CG07_land_8_20_14_0_80_38_8]|nr:MAG: hypothetical protein COS83_01540 [archaeon CG07_land_8_20_14_0_80_38_8]